MTFHVVLKLKLLSSMPQYTHIYIYTYECLISGVSANVVLPN